MDDSWMWSQEGEKCVAYSDGSKVVVFDDGITCSFVGPCHL